VRLRVLRELRGEVLFEGSGWALCPLCLCGSIFFIATDFNEHNM